MLWDCRSALDVWPLHDSYLELEIQTLIPMQSLQTESSFWISNQRFLAIQSLWWPVLPAPNMVQESVTTSVRGHCLNSSAFIRYTIFNSCLFAAPTVYLPPVLLYCLWSTLPRELLAPALGLHTNGSTCIVVLLRGWFFLWLFLPGSSFLYGSSSLPLSPVSSLLSVQGILLKINKIRYVGSYLSSAQISVGSTIYFKLKFIDCLSPAVCWSLSALTITRLFQALSLLEISALAGLIFPCLGWYHLSL